MAKKIVYDFLTKETVVKDITSEEQKALDAIIPDAEIELANLRSARNSLLAGTDYMTLSDMPTMSDAWKKYRQELRDITKTFKSMRDKDFKFPEKPTE